MKKLDPRQGKTTFIDEDYEPDETPPEVVTPRPALELLNRLRRGQVMDLLAMEINRVVRAVKDTDTKKGGSVTLTLKIDPVKPGLNTVYIQAVIAGKAPEDPPTVDMLFYDNDGNLFSRDPDQVDFLYEGGPRQL